MKKYLAIFAHYDKDQIIDDYVILYLQGLKKVAQDIIFVSDGELSDLEKKKLDGICFEIIAQKHGEYDFGSWKRGLKRLEREALERYDGLILANDSCYLISSLVPVFQEMERRNSYDFWGVAQSEQYGTEHIHSYFMVFNKKVFLSEIFKIFFANVKKEQKKIDIIKNYEIGLSKTLVNAGFLKDSFFKEVICSRILGKSCLFKKLLPNQYPFIKINILLRNISVTSCKPFVDKKLYDIICANLMRRVGVDNLLESYSIMSFQKFFLHKKLFMVSIKDRKLSVKLFGIPLLKIKIQREC